MSHIRDIYRYWYYQLVRHFEGTALPALSKWKAGSVLVLFLTLTIVSTLSCAAVLFDVDVFSLGGTPYALSPVLVATAIHYVLVDLNPEHDEYESRAKRIKQEDHRKRVIVGWVVAIFVIAYFVASIEISRRWLLE